MARSTISIHALREESDQQSPVRPCTETQFQSTPSARRATELSYVVGLLYDRFQSTPSARRATTAVPYRLRISSISIHALREESDDGSAMM